MNLEQARNLINKYLSYHSVFVRNALIAQRYYLGDNDILHREPKEKLQGGKPNPLRCADNKIAFNFHQLLVNQKASYLFTAPPLFDVKDDIMNEYIANVLGDAYAKKAKDLCVEASNSGVGWLHYWIDNVKGFRWAVIPSMQIYPVYSTRLEKSYRLYLEHINLLMMKGKNGIFVSYGIIRNVLLIDNVERYLNHIIFLLLRV